MNCDVVVVLSAPSRRRRPVKICPMLEADCDEVSNNPGKDRAKESLEIVSSSLVSGSVRMRANSLKISLTAGAVTSVRTPVPTTNGPGPRRKENAEPAP